jgi:hypothetical protein
VIADLVLAGGLDPGVSAESSWEQAADLLAALGRREINGKAILHLDA